MKTSGHIDNCEVKVEGIDVYMSFFLMRVMKRTEGYLGEKGRGYLLELM